jgi:hypothetical protein
MSFERAGDRIIDYAPCRYGRSKLLFRGPRQRMQGRYIAVLGGTETYGRFMAQPWPALLQDQTGTEVVNLGLQNAGVDVFLNEPILHDICAGADVTVIQVLGAANMSNRFYAVHPRRNDRFLRASSMLKALYPDLDFAVLNFVRHLLAALADRSPDRFEVVRLELREAWLARMKLLLTRIPGRKVLLWLTDHAPGNAVPPGSGLGRDPLFVDADMLADLRTHVADIVTVSVTPQQVADGRAGLVFGDLDLPVVQDMLGTHAHDQAAGALADTIARLSRA